MEFSGGINNKASSQKNAKDIEKLYTNMVKVMEDNKANKMFCIRCFGKNMSYLILSYTKPPFYNTIGHNIYFEKLVQSDGVMYRTVDVNVEISTTPRKLIAYINEIPNIIAWKGAVINHALNLK